MKEAQARIKINKLLEAAGWRFLDDASGRANVALELNVKLTKDDVNELGEDFESTANGFVDFLLLDDNGAPLVVLEAKAESKAVTEVEESLRGGVGLVHITKGNLERIAIPLPPLEVQKEIVAELESYQKAVQSAKAAIEIEQQKIQAGLARVWGEAP